MTGPARGLPLSLESLDARLRALQIDLHKVRTHALALELLLVSGTNADLAWLAQIVRKQQEKTVADGLTRDTPDEAIDIAERALRELAERLELLAEARRSTPKANRP
jgi:hypothetical protein